MYKPEQKTVQEDEAMYESVRRLGDLLLPSRIDYSDVTQHINGYDKKKALDQLVQRAKEDPLITKVKLHLVYCELYRLVNNGGL